MNFRNFGKPNHFFQSTTGGGFKSDPVSSGGDKMLTDFYGNDSFVDVSMNSGPTSGTDYLFGAFLGGIDNNP